MESEKSFIVKIVEKSGELIKDVRNDGNMYVLSGLSADELVEVACEIFKKLNRSPLVLQSTRDAIMAGKETRPQGAFALSIRKNVLYVELRNGAGYKPMVDELREAIDSI